MPTVTRVISYFAPDDFSASRQTSAGTGLKYAVAASSSRFTSDGSSEGESSGQNQLYNHNNHDDYDEGLVHSHGWASNN